MKWSLSLIFLVCLGMEIGRASESIFYRGQSRSMIDWSDVDTDEWLNFTKWKQETELKDAVPDWERLLRERTLKQVMGRALECYGDCRVYKGAAFNSLNYRSQVHPGDEIMTYHDSYLWLFLMDGTLVRLGPDTSISLREINIGQNENMVHVRLNSGNILWLSRSENSYQIKNDRETDTLFLPLSLEEANPPALAKEQKEDLFDWLIPDNTMEQHYQRLNQLIEENNQWALEKKTYAFLVMPNGTVFGHSVQAEFIVLLGGESYIKQRSAQQLQWSEGARDQSLTFFYRGFENTSEYTISPGQWYRVDERGRSIERHNPISLFGVGEFLTSRIPTVLTAREILLARYSRFAHERLSGLELARDYGYRLWGRLDRPEDDLSLRLNFLKEHTRRNETTNLVTATRFKERLAERGEILESMVYSARFFNRALIDFKIKPELKYHLNAPEGEGLNSEQKPLWKRMHAKPRAFSRTFLNSEYQ